MSTRVHTLVMGHPATGSLTVWRQRAKRGCPQVILDRPSLVHIRVMSWVVESGGTV